MALKMHPSLAVHPGDWLKSEVVEPRGIEINDIADNFRVSRQTVSAVLNGRSAVTAGMAIKFERAFGVRAETLLRMQAAFDLARAHEAVDDEPVRAYA